MSGAWVEYYAKLGFGILMLSGVILGSLYIVRRKLQLDRMLAGSLRMVVPKWLEFRGKSLGGRVEGERLVVEKPEYKATVEAQVAGQAANLMIHVVPAEPFAPFVSVGPRPPGESPGATGMDAATGDADFDRLFQARGSSEVLTEVVRRSLVGVSRRGTVGMTLSPAGLHLTFASKDLPWKILSGVFDDLVKVATGMATSVARGGALPETACPVCGRSVAAERLTCGACGAAHHRDCWAYNARCGAYRCGATVSR